MLYFLIYFSAAFLALFIIKAKLVIINAQKSKPFYQINKLNSAPLF